MTALNQLRLKMNTLAFSEALVRIKNYFGIKRNRRKFLIISLAFLIPVAVFVTLMTGKAKADWYDDAYNQRQEVSFTHNADVSSERRISVTVDTATLISDGVMQEDCNDVIFTTIGGDILKYTLVSGCNTSSTVFDVVLDSISNGGNDIFMYYSNPTAYSTTDGTVSSVTSVSPSGGTPTLGSVEIGPSPSIYLKMDEAYGITAHDSTSNLNNATFGGTMTQDQVLRQEINIIDHIATASGDDPSLVLLDTENYSGTKTYYFEIVAKVASGTLTVALERSGTSTQDATITVTETDFTRKRSASFTPPSGETEYNINLSGGTSTEVKSARILIYQDVGQGSMTATEAQIELGNYEVGKSNTSAAALNYPKYWKYEEDNWDGTTAFSTEVSWKKTYGDASSTTVTYTTAGTGSWSCPSGASNIFVEAWGGGGAGGGDNTDNSVAAAGGGGGAYAASTVSLSCPGNYTYVVGAGGTGTTGNGNDGGDSSFDSTGVNVKGGGGGGSEGGAVGPGGSAAASNGTTKYNGGDGYTYTTSTGGGGGGSAGPSSDGNDATSSTGATAVSGGGPGGNGGASGANGGTPASGPGGGGGGSGDKDGTGASKNRTGGAGRAGQIKITYESVVATYTVTIKLQEDDGSFGSWTDKQTIVDAVSSVTTPTRTRVSFTPTDGRHYRIVGSISNAADTYDIYNAKIVATQTGEIITKTESRYLLANTLLSSGTAPQNFDTYFDPDEVGHDSSTTYYHEAAGASSSSSSIKLQTDPNSSPSDISNSTLTPSNYAITTAISAPSSAQTVDVVAATNNNDIYSSSIFGIIVLETTPTETYPTWIASNDYCISNGCILFDGANDMLRIDDHESINFAEKLNDEFTVQAWVRPASAGESNSGGIFFKGTNNYLRLGAGSDSTVADLVASIDLGTTDATITVDDALTIGQWHHVALTYTDDGDDEVTVYVDGEVVGTSTDGSGAPVGGTDTLTVGGTATTNHFDGYIDEFKIYGEERTSIQMKTDIIRYSPTLHGTSAAFGNNTTNFSTEGITAYWKMDDGSGTVATDSSGLDNDATLNEDVTWDTGIYNGATSFDGAGDYLDAGSSPSLTVSEGVTISGWVQMDEGFSGESDYNQGIVDKGDYQFYLDKSDGKARWVVNDVTAKVFSAIGGDNVGVGYSEVYGVKCFVVYNGYLYVGGSFTTAGGTTVNYIAKYDDATNTFSAIGGGTVGTNDTVVSLAVYNGYLYVGGYFTTAGGTTVNYIAKYDDATNTFSAIGGGTVGTGGTVYSLAVYNGYLYVGGSFTTAGGTTVNRIAKYDDATNTFSAIGGATVGISKTGGSDEFVYCLAVHNGYLYLGGNFDTAGGTTVNNIAKYDDATNTFSAIGGGTVGTGDTVNSLAVYNGYLYVGGGFTTAGGTTVNRIAKYDDATNTFSAIGGATVGTGSTVYSLAVYNGYLYLGGFFTTAGGTTVNYIAKYDDATNTFSAIGGATVGVYGDTFHAVYSLAVYNGYLYVGGSFDTAGGTTVKNIAKYGPSSDTDVSVESTTSTWTADTWYHLSTTFDDSTLKIYVNGVLESTVVNNSPFNISAENKKLIIGKTYGSQMAGGSDESFDGLIDDLRIYNTALTDSEVYSLYNLSPPPDLYYKFEENTGTDVHDSSGNQQIGTLTNGAGWAPGRYGTGATFDGVDDFVTTDSSAYISPESGVAVSGWVKMDEEFSTGADYNQGIVDKGDYQFYLDKSDGKARWVVNDATAKVFSAIGGGTVGTNDTVVSLAVYNGYLYVGGYFTTAGGTTVNYIAKYDDATNTFSAIGGGTVGTGGTVYSLAVYNGYLYVGGSFTTAGGTTVNRIAKYDDATNTFSAIGGATVGANNSLTSLIVYNGYLYLGGYFTTAGGTTVNRIAKYDDATNTFSAIGGATVGTGSTVYSLAVYNGYLYVGGSFTTAGGTTVNYIAKYDDATNTFSAIGGGTVGVYHSTDPEVSTLAVYNGYLYLGGFFTTAGGTTVNQIAKYDDATNTFSAIGGATLGTNSSVKSLIVYNGYLYLGGGFTTAGGTTVNRIAKYDDATNTFSAIGGATVGTGSTVYSLAVYNGYLYVGGSFTTAGGTTVNFISKYGSSSDTDVVAKSTTSTWTADTWYHLSGTFDGSNLKIYVNGVLENTTTNSTPFSLTTEDKSLLLGKTYGSQMAGGSGENFKGKLDDFKIYSYAPVVKNVIKDLDAQIPAPDSTLGAPIGHWRFDEDGGTTIYDRTGNSRNLTLVASPPTATAFTVSGKYNKAFYPGGTNYAYVDNNAFVFNSESFAINAWFRSDSSSNPSSTEYVLGRGGNTTEGYALYFNTSGNIVFGIDDDSTWGPDDTVLSDLDVYDGQWHSVTAVKKGNSRIDLYIDGILQNSNTALSATGSIDGDNTLVIGARGGDYSGVFAGSVDEITIYNFDIAQSEANVLLNQGKISQWGSLSTEIDGVTPSNSYDRMHCIPGDTTACSGPVLDLRFEEGTGSTSADTSGVGNTATLLGNVSWVPGKYGSALGFDGNDDFTTTGSSSYLSPTSTITVSGWILMDQGFSTSSPSNMGIVDKGDYKFYLDKTDGKAKWVVNDNVAKAFSALGSGTVGTSGIVYTLAVYNNNLYIGGSFTTAGTTTVNNVAKYNDSTNTFTALGSGTVGTSDTVNAMTVYNGNLYLVGDFTTAGGTTVNYIASYNDGTNAFSTVGTGTAGLGAGADILSVYNNNLYVGGRFTATAAGTTVNYIAKYNSSTNAFSAIGGSTVGTSGGTFVYALGVYNGNLYLGGNFTSAGGTTVNYIAKYNDSSNAFSAIGGGTVGTDGNVNTIAIYNGNLYAGGAFYAAGGTTVNYVAKYNDVTNSFYTIGGATPGTGSNVNIMAVLNNDLYVGGDFTTAGGSSINYIAKYNDTTNTFSDITGTSGSVSALAVYNNNLYVGGNFQSANSATMWRVAKYGTSNLKTVASTTSSWAPSNWYHLVGTFDNTNLKIYVNGVLENVTTNASPFALSSQSANLYTGKTYGSQWVGGSGEVLKGKIDDVKVYNYVRTIGQINWEYNRMDAMYKYKFNECSGVTANNSARNSNDTAVGVNLTIYPGSTGNVEVGTCAGSANEMWYGGTDGKFNGSLDFDGTDDYAASSNTALLVASSSTYTNISFSAWVYPATSSASDTIIHKNNEFRMTTDSSAVPQCEIYSGSWQTAAVSTSALPISTWTHVLCTYDGSDIKIYVNGELKDTQAETDAITSTSSSALNIARDSAGSGYFDGKIDEVTIHTSALNTNLSKILFNENAALRFGN